MPTQQSQHCPLRIKLMTSHLEESFHAAWPQGPSLWHWHLLQLFMFSNFDHVQICWEIEEYVVPLPGWFPDDKKFSSYVGRRLSERDFSFTFILLRSSEHCYRLHTTHYTNQTPNMKLTWKRSESSKKRPISHFPNLPFSDDASENLSVEGSSFPKEESPRNDDVQEKTAAAILNGDGETLRLAHSFQEQGNKLAEVKKKI